MGVRQAWRRQFDAWQDAAGYGRLGLVRHDTVGSCLGVVRYGRRGSVRSALVVRYMSWHGRAGWVRRIRVGRVALWCGRAGAVWRGRIRLDAVGLGRQGHEHLRPPSRWP